MKDEVRFKYKSRSYVAMVRNGEILIVRGATRRFNETSPQPINVFMPEIQRRAREALNA